MESLAVQVGRATRGARNSRATADVTAVAAAQAITKAGVDGMPANTTAHHVSAVIAYPRSIPASQPPA